MRSPRRGRGAAGERPSVLQIGRRLLGRSLGLALAVSAAGACTLLTSTKADQCATDADCLARGPAFDGYACGADRVCAPQAKLGCDTNKQCIDANGGQPFTCKKAERRCVQLTSKECTKILFDPGDLENNNALYLGVTVLASGGGAGQGLANIDAIELARRDLRDAAGGLPSGSGGPKRPLVFIVCDEAADVAASLSHQIDIGVPGIIGPMLSANVIRQSGLLTIPSNVMIMSPTASSPLLTTLDKQGLVYSLSPSDALLAAMMGLFVSQTLEPKLKGTGGTVPTGADMRVGVFESGTATGSGMVDSLLTTLNFNGLSASANGANFKIVNYGDPSQPGATDRFASAALAMAGFEPHIVVGAGTPEVPANLIPALETSWPSSSTFRPTYVLHQSGQATSTLKFIGSDESKRKRIFGGIPGNPNRELFKKYVLRHTSTFPATAATANFVSADSYDAAFMLAYSIVAAGNQPLNGTALATGLKMLLPPFTQQYDVGPDAVSQILSTLQQGQGIDLNGASSSLNIDIAKGAPVTDITVWCVTKDAASGAATGFGFSGMIYNADTQKLEGTIDTTTCAW